jgi:hypothetical protein
MPGCSLTNNAVLKFDIRSRIHKNADRAEFEDHEYGLVDLEGDDSAEAERECSLMGSEIGEHFMIPTAPRMTWQREDDG